MEKNLGEEHSGQWEEQLQSPGGGSGLREVTSDRARLVGQGAGSAGPKYKARPPAASLGQAHRGTRPRARTPSVCGLG